MLMTNNSQIKNIDLLSSEAIINKSSISILLDRYATSHARPTYCNVCRDALSGVTSHGLSCEVCKCKVHKRCAAKAVSNCKWTTLASVGKDIIEDKDGVSSIISFSLLLFLKYFGIIIFCLHVF